MKKIRFVYPQQTIAVSITGSKCQLNCAHCGGYYLTNMTPFAAVISGERQALGSSWLVSGGCKADGSISFEKYLKVLGEMKGKRKFNIHVGLIKKQEISGIAALADRVSFDFVGDDDTIREVFGISRTVDDYVDCYQNLRSQVPVTPHICIGLHGGRLRGELKALELLHELGADSLTLIVFTPTKGTRYADCSPPPLQEVANLFNSVRHQFSKVPINLGCMRPGGRYRRELDILAVKAGLNCIVNPALDAVALAAKLGIFITRGEECCCFG